jgi:hypothetical protein
MIEESNRNDRQPFVKQNTLKSQNSSNSTRAALSHRDTLRSNKKSTI